MHVQKALATQPLKHGEEGMSLLSLLVAVGVLSVVGLMTATLLARTFGSQNHVEVRGELEDLKRDLRWNIGCKESFPSIASACIVPGPVEIRSTKNSKGLSTVLISKNGTTRWKKTNFVLKARCEFGKKFVVQVNRISPSGKVLADSLTGKLLDGITFGETTDQSKGWDKDLFDGVMLCKL